MTAQFGQWNFGGQPMDPDSVARVIELLHPCGDIGQGHTDDGFFVSYLALHSTQASWKERQPVLLPSGAVLVWNGRLDNREDLLTELSTRASSSDAEIVAAAYESWGVASFAKLVGDWELSVWSPKARSLTLATDFLAHRSLYYFCGQNSVAWSSVLDPLVLLSKKSLSLDEEYLAGWFGFFPAAHLTPYHQIRRVPPASYVLCHPDSVRVREYWKFDLANRIRYSSDREYEEHFRSLFRQSVRRRLRSVFPVLAELSGGMDSSSIVCVADKILEDRDGSTKALDTLSYYSETEPDWNELPYLGEVERKRGRVGYHVRVSSLQRPWPEYDDAQFSARPGSNATPTDATREFRNHLSSRNYGVVLSGFGGDEVLGGVPTPVPELANLFAGLRFASLFHQVAAWALAKRTSALRLLLDTIREFLSTGFGSDQLPSPPWLRRAFRRRYGAAVAGYPSRFKLFGPLPSFQSNCGALEVLGRQIASFPSEPGFEVRYPYLDRDLLEFLFAIPREQIVRPGERRSLLRRSLAGVVPDVVQQRKRKATVHRGPLTAISSFCAADAETREEMLTDSLGFIDAGRFREFVRIVSTKDDDTHMVATVRTLAVEFWLRHLRAQRVVIDWTFDQHALALHRAASSSHASVRSPERRVS